jgi:hypothetical protein
MSKNVTRLYKQFIPEQYQLHLSVDETNMTFTGKVTIRGKKTGQAPHLSPEGLEDHSGRSHSP